MASYVCEVVSNNLCLSQSLLYIQHFFLYERSFLRRCSYRFGRRHYGDVQVSGIQTLERVRSLVLSWWICLSCDPDMASLHIISYLLDPLKMCWFFPGKMLWRLCWACTITSVNRIKDKIGLSLRNFKHNVLLSVDNLTIWKTSIITSADQVT